MNTLPRLLPGWLLLTLITVLSGCSTQAPDWLNNVAEQYPDARFLTAVADADQRQTAGDRALANLAKIFEVEVTDSGMDFSSAESVSGAAGSQISNEQRVSRTVNTETRQVLEGAKVVEYFEDELHRFHALAVLEKQPAANRLRQRIQASDRKVNDLIKYASEQAPNPVVALNSLQQARLAQIGRDQLNRNLLVVANGQGISTGHDTGAIEDKIRQALATLRCAVEADDPSLQTELQRAVNQLGMTIDPNAVMVVKGLMDLTPVSERQGWYWIQGSYEVVLVDGTNVLAKKRWPVKSSATDPNLVQQRLKDDINAALPNQVFELLTTARH